MKRLIVEKEKVLPLNNNAKIKYDLMLYMEMEALLSNIKTRESAKAWYMTNYTQLYCLRSDKAIANKKDFYKNVHISQPKNPFIKEKITSFCFYKSSSILNFIIKQISKGNYIKILLDHFFLHGYGFYNTKHVFHTEFIYGYDLSTKKLYIIGSNNLRMGGFARTEISFGDFIKAYESAKKRFPFKPITLLGINDKKKYSLKIKKLKKGLLSYYDSKSHFTNKIIALNDKHSLFKVYGLNTYTEIANILKHEFYVLKQPSLNSIKYLQALADYKKMMLQRIEILYENGFLQLNKFNCLHSDYVEIVNGFNIIINLYIKNFVSSKSNTDKIINRLNELERKEKKVIGSLIGSLTQAKRSRIGYDE